MMITDEDTSSSTSEDIDEVQTFVALLVSKERRYSEGPDETNKEHAEKNMYVSREFSNYFTKIQNVLHISLHSFSSKAFVRVLQP